MVYKYYIKAYFSYNFEIKNIILNFYYVTRIILFSVTKLYKIDSIGSHLIKFIFYK